ncbi:fatty acid-binding protein, liver-type-like isoform X1 [Euwallacea similis]|uniref:fatty acid-binding protein, liver-type-like isoform X1 n=1 Tax=Euwallacea similis TaxID=1736056 RepID=UPI00344B785C
MSLAGKYQNISNEGFLEHFTANGLPADRAKQILENTKNIEIIISDDNITITRGGKLNSTTHLINNKETTESAPDGKVFKHFTVLNGNTLTIDSGNDEFKWKRIYSLSGPELTLRSISSKDGVPDGIRIYKKL